jgi:hypothetical protein
VPIDVDVPIDPCHIPINETVPSRTVPGRPDVPTRDANELAELTD